MLQPLQYLILVRIIYWIKKKTYWVKGHQFTRMLTQSPGVTAVLFRQGTGRPERPHLNQLTSKAAPVRGPRGIMHS